MTSTTFGGGPSIEARRNFSNLKPGAQVPGYGGYIHQLKFNNGHTYGDHTHILLNRSVSDLGSLNYSQKTESRNLPKSTGGNKLTESMISGYTGYIPSRKFQFSNNYRVECDSCIGDFVTSRNEKFMKNNDIMNHVMNAPKLARITSDIDLKREVDNFKDRNAKYNVLKNDKRETTEPPIPGYTGFIPRIGPTELGLGATYHNTTERGLNDFKRNYLKEKFGSASVAEFTDSTTASVNNSKRIYVPPGLVPKYTGYVHGKKFQFGHTYGNTTRELPVCNHKSASFGQYMNENIPKTAIC